MTSPRSGEWRRRTASAALAVLASVATVRAAGPATGTSSTPTTTATVKTPSSDRLPHGSIGTSAGTPFAWVDDASLLGPGSAAVTLSAVGWQGTGAHELEAPVVGAAVGVVPRLQLSVHAPYVMGDQRGNGVAGGWGTTYLSGKIGVVQGDSIKLSVAPTLQVLDPSALTSTAISRAQWGVPVSAGIDRGPAHVFASAGYFSGGVGFAGGGVSVDVSPRVMVSGSLSHAWTGTTTTDPAVTRTDLSGGASFALTSHIGFYGSVGQTVGTTDASGAGTTVVAGVSILAGPSASRP